MSRKDNCLDNTMAESFFGIMKSELLYAENFESTEAFIKALDNYIEYYNNKSQVKWKESGCLLYTSPSPRDVEESRMPSSA